METLTKNEICAYLPHKLMCQYEGIINGKEIATHRKEFTEENHPFTNWEHYVPIEPIEGLKIGYLKSIHAYNNYYVAKCGIKNQGLKKFYNGRDLKPILYPLDYLTKQITHNGETFVPIEFLKSKYNNTLLIYFDRSLSIDITTDDYTQEIDLFKGYLIMQQLLEWRFDCFNLINRGLAMPITETFNPYK